jgi:hypothetical protein
MPNGGDIEWLTLRNARIPPATVWPRKERNIAARIATMQVPQSNSRAIAVIPAARIRWPAKASLAETRRL